MPAEKTEQVMVRLSPELLDELRARARDEERSVAQTVRLAIREHLGHVRLGGEGSVGGHVAC